MEHDPDGELPALDLAVVENEQELAAAVDDVILRVTRLDPELGRLQAELLLQEEALQSAFPEAWPQFLLVEELVNARTAELATRLARWAFTEGFNEGERYGRRSGGAP